MRRRSPRTGWLATAICALAISSPAVAGATEIGYAQQSIVLGGQALTVRIAKGYELQKLATMSAPRLLAFAPNGDLFAGSRAGKVYRLAPPYTEATVYARLSRYPHSVAFRDGEILIARNDGVYRAPYRAGDARLDLSTLQRLARLPAGGGHDSRSIGVGPDGRVYASLGISGNCSDQFLEPPYPFADRRGGILVLDESATPARWRSYASGLRNPVGFDWQPGSGVLFASNNGPDHLGFEQPPEVFARTSPGSFHGMPWFQYDGRRLTRDTCAQSRPPRPELEVTPPAATFPARNAPMGVAFIPENSNNGPLAGDAVVALRGSWGTNPGGGFMGDPASRRPPKLVLVRFSRGKVDGVVDLLTGFQLPDGDRWARPVGVAAAADGSIYFSSDSGFEGLYRLRRIRP